MNVDVKAIVLANDTSCDCSLDVAEPATLEVWYGVRQVVGGECEEWQQWRPNDLGTTLNDRPVNKYTVHNPFYYY